MTQGSSEFVSNGSELIHLIGRHTNKASVLEHVFLDFFSSAGRSDINPNDLRGHQHPHRHLEEGGFSMELVLYRISIYYSS